MRKEDFLRFPDTDYCTSILSIASPGSGKTYILLKCLKAWIDMGMFEEYHVILPSYKNEMSQSYDWLESYDHVYIYEDYYEMLGSRIVAQQEKNHELFKKKKLKAMPKIFLGLDDATGINKNLFQSTALKRAITENRHLRIQTWILLHADKGVISPKIRQNIFFVFLYKMKDNLLKHCYNEYVNFPQDFDDYKNDFKPFFVENVVTKEYGAMLLAGSRCYNTDIDLWFPDDSKKKEVKNKISTTDISNEQSGEFNGKANKKARVQQTGKGESEKASGRTRSNFSNE